jgi:hypothetical protein
MGTVKTTDADMNDARLESPAVVRGDRDSRERDLSEALLTEADR